MKRNVSNLSVGLALIGVLFLAVFIPIPACAAEVWSDDFDDGNYDDWTVRVGVFTCVDGYLKATAEDSTDVSGIYHNSTVTSGTWSFDFFHTTGMLYPVLMTNKESIFWGWNLLLSISNSRITISTYQQPDAWPPLVRASWDFPPGFEGWTHIDVTIAESGSMGNIQVFVNGTHSLSNSFLIGSKIMQYFVIASMAGIGNSVDNIVVSDTIDVECTNASCELDHFTTTSDTTTNDTTTPTDGAALPLELIALGGGIAVVVIVLVLFLKRKV